MFRFVRIVLIVYLIILLLLMFFENHLVYPSWGFPDAYWEEPTLDYLDVTFASADGTKLHGWYFEHPTPRAHVMMCHGNGIHLGHMAESFEGIRDEFQVSVFAFDYRGYGRSEGKPNEEGVLADGRAAHLWLAKQAGIAPSDVVLIGQSLGGAVAVDCAAQHGARGLILERAFSSMVDVAARHYPWVPVRLLMRNRYECLEKIAAYDGPLLQCHGTADEIVPFEIGKRLFDASPSQAKRFVEMPGVSHNSIGTREYEIAFGEFLANLP